MSAVLRLKALSRLTHGSSDRPQQDSRVSRETQLGEEEDHLYLTGNKSESLTNTDPEHY